MSWLSELKNYLTGKTRIEPQTAELLQMKVRQLIVTSAEGGYVEIVAGKAGGRIFMGEGPGKEENSVTIKRAPDGTMSAEFVGPLKTVVAGIDVLPDGTVNRR